MIITLFHIPKWITGHLISNSRYHMGCIVASVVLGVEWMDTFQGRMGGLARWLTGGKWHCNADEAEWTIPKHNGTESIYFKIKAWRNKMFLTFTAVWPQSMVLCSSKGMVLMRRMTLYRRGGSVTLSTFFSTFFRTFLMTFSPTPLYGADEEGDAVQRRRRYRRGGSVTRDKQTIRSGDSSTRCPGC